MKTWKQVRDRETLGAYRGQGIFVDFLARKFKSPGRQRTDSRLISYQISRSELAHLKRVVEYLEPL